MPAPDSLLVTCLILWGTFLVIVVGVLATRPQRSAFDLECESHGGRPLRVAERGAGALCVSEDGRVILSGK